MKKAQNADDFLNYISGTTDIWPPPLTVARSNDDNVTNVDDDDEKLRTQQQQPIPSILSGSYQGLYPNYPHHLLNINFQQTEDVIWSMISRANTAMA